MKNKKRNNKGFSLVELIVVIAIMAILAVTLAPKLTQYIEKARVASDQQAINTIFTTAQAVNAEHPLANGTTLTLSTTLYDVNASGKRTDWTLKSSYTYGTNQPFVDNLIAGLSNFTLKSKDVSDTTEITLSTDSRGFISVGLDYTPVANDPATAADESADDYVAHE